MPAFDHVVLYTDGGSRGNPGPGAIGVVVYSDGGQLLYEHSECIGHCTNNQAEYRALIKGLDLAKRYAPKRVTVHSDSKLVMSHMSGAYKVRNDILGELFQEAKDRERSFLMVKYEHVPRTDQGVSHADELNRQAYAGRPVSICHVQP